MSIENSKQLDSKNGDTLWKDAIAKEMYQVLVAFKIFEEGESPPPGWTKSTGHIIFDVKMYFARNARWVNNGHLNPDPETSSYAGVVSCESIWILLTTAALQGVNLLAADI